MTVLRNHALELLIGLVLDLLLGDPENLPHPVILIGKYISFCEKRVRAQAKGDSKELRRGSVWLTASTCALAMAVTACILFLASLVGFWVYVVVSGVLSWTCLAAKSLSKEARGVAKALDISLDAGRKQVARIVGRDTAALSEAEVAAAAVETVAENTTDGVVSPMIYLFLGGPVLAMGFKAASTLDSMVGYLDEKYRDIGWSGARLDDILNYIPARLSGLLMCLSACLCGKDLDGKNAFRIMKRDHANHLSPNCAWTESAAAGALHIRLGGTHEYFGKTIEKPSIGDGDRPIETEDILRTCRLMVGTEFLAAGLLVLFAVMI